MKAKGGGGVGELANYFNGDIFWCEGGDRQGEGLGFGCFSNFFYYPTLLVMFFYIKTCFSVPFQRSTPTAYYVVI